MIYDNIKNIEKNDVITRLVKITVFIFLINFGNIFNIKNIVISFLKYNKYYLKNKNVIMITLW